MEETNIIIAEFMGYKLCEREECGHENPHYITGPSNWDITFPKNFRFHESYNEFMPVWHKFRALYLPQDLKPLHDAYCICIAMEITESPILNPAYKWLVDGIKWYKNQDLQ
jgi:hypothetical protein